MQTKSILLAAAAAIVGVAGQAHAQATIYGNGASLPAPYIRQIFDCYGTDFPLVTRTGNPVAAATPSGVFRYNPDVNSDGTPDGVIRDCSSETANVLSNFRGVYVSTGSGRGIQGIFSHSASFAGDYVVGDALTTLFPSGPHYGLSEAGLGDNDVANYNLGNGGGRPATQSLTILAPGNATPDPLPSNTFRNPRERYGALVQFPLLIAPVNIAFDPIYRKYNHPTLGLQEYRLRIQNPRTALDSNGNTVTTGGIRLTPSAYCRIFHGEITNWNDTQLRSPAITGNPTTFRDTNDVTQTNANFSAPIQIVGRSDSSGTTSIFTRHLSAVCDAFVASNAFTTAGNTALPASRISTAIWNATTQTLSGTETLGLFTRSAGNEGVADYLDFRAVPSASLNDSGRGFTFNAGINAADVLTQARIGYVGPDYVLPAVLTTQTNTYGLTTADLFNANGQNVVPAPTGARLAYELFPVVAGADRQNPARWVAPLERFVPYDINQDGAFDVADNPDTATVNDPADRNPLANPFSATDPSFRAYPMLGTTNALLYTCYQAGSVRSAILRFFQEYERRSNLNTDNLANDTDQGLLDSAGLSSVPNGWQNAIRTVFFTTDTNTGDANAQAIQVVTSADGNGTFTNRFGQPSPESNQCAGLVGTGAGGGGGGESPSPPTFSINDVAATEGNALTFTVTRNGSTTSQVSVSFATQNGTAIAGSDYTAQSGTLTFGSGVTSQTISVPTVADQITEGSETFTILLSNAVGATITDGSGTGTINDQINPNEPRPTFSISGTPSVNEGGTLQFTVTKSSVTTGTYSVTATTSGGTATPGSDYTAINQLLSFAPSETSRTVTVNTVDDGTLESSETVNLTIASSNANIGTASTTGTILDNDAPPNRNPIATPSTAGVNSCKPEIFTPSVSDPDGDPLFLTSVSVGTIDGLNIIFDGSETDIPNQPPNPPSPLGGTANYNLFVNYTVSDSRGGTASSYIDVTVRRPVGAACY